MLVQKKLLKTLFLPFKKLLFGKESCLLVYLSGHALAAQNFVARIEEEKILPPTGFYL